MDCTEFVVFRKKETGERINLVKFEYDAGRNFVNNPINVNIVNDPSVFHPIYKDM
jgi:hypothetical protein